MPDSDSGSTVLENWIKPPKIVNYTNSKLITYGESLLVCEFFFPIKYYGNDFYLNDGTKVLNRGEMYRGKRFFYSDRNYSLLEFYSDTDELTAYYFDLTLPAILKKDSVTLLDIKLDFFVMPDKKKYFLLDEDELEDAISKNLFSQKEIDCCRRTTDFIRKCIETDSFDNIFKDFERSSPDQWERYSMFR